MGWAGPKHYCNIELKLKYLNINAIQQYENIHELQFELQYEDMLVTNNGIYNNKHTHVIHHYKKNIKHCLQ